MSKKKRSRKRKRRQGPVPNLNSKNVRESAKVSEFPIKELTTANLSSLTLRGVNNFIENCDKTALSDCGGSMVADYGSTPLRTEKRNDLRDRKIRSNSSMAKLHSPGVEKVRLKSNTATQTITETPRLNRNCLLDMEYEIDLLDKSLYTTPLRHILPNNLTPIFDLKDLNNLRDNFEEKITNCSRNLNENNLKRLRNFNEVISNTTQDVNYDNCDLFDHVETINVQGLDFKETNQMEMSFFTPQLYNGGSASTPIHKSFITNPLDENCVFENATNDVSHPKSNFVSISTQVEEVTYTDIGLQTSRVDLKSDVTPKVRVKCTSISRRRSYKSMTPTISYFKIFPKHDVTIRVSPTRNVIVNRSKVEVTDMCGSIFSIIRKLHSRYSSRVPEKIFDLCTWLGCTIKKSLSSFYKVYKTNKSETKEGNDLGNAKCQLYQISILKSGIDDLKTEFNRMEKDSMGSSVKFNIIDAELAKLNKELTALKQQLHGIKEVNSQVAYAPPPPPPPIPPPPPPFPPANTYIVSHTKTTKVSTKKKINENSRPIISLDDILKVKLKKIADRPTPIHRVTEPQMSTLLQNVKLRSARSNGQTRSSSTASSVSSSSNSPCSSLTRILSNVNTNVCRVKRLHRVRNYSFDEFSRKSLSKRDLEN